MRTKLFKKINLPLLGRGLGGGLLLLLLLFAAACSKDEAPTPNPELSVTPADIPAAYTAGTYTIAVTSNVAWTASVNTAATWCSVLPATGTGNGAVTVNVGENAALTTRTATVTLAAGTLTRTVGVTQAATVFHAASTQTWTFGEQTWSDAIHCPECNKETFEDSYIDPQCRSYTESGKTWYYYNWAYVDANKTTMCPDPWRVPSSSDISMLLSNLGGSEQSARDQIIADWGSGGDCYGGGVSYVTTRAYYWSSYFDGTYVTVLYVFTDRVGVASQQFTYSGHQVRCVK
jgi:uncharacterized protein (TIGR02145 family)